MRILSLLLALCACQRTPSQDHRSGQTSFLSAPPGQSRGANALGNSDGGSATTPTSAGGSGGGTPRAVEETDIYRLDGNRLYTLNGYRGLLVFDLSDVDHPKLLGRSPIYGWPIEMVVHGGVATVVVSDWYGQKADGTPFHGSVVRGLDATDPANIRALGEAQLAGWVQDTRVVGEVLYAVSQDYGWTWGASAAGSVATPSVVVSAVNLAGGAVQKMGERSYAGWSGVINVTASSILLAHDATLQGSQGTTTQLTYIDISDPAGTIVERGSLLVPGRLQGWGPDNGRWNLDFADGKTAHLFGCSALWCGDSNSAPYLLTTVSFANPNAPVQVSSLSLQLSGWTPAVRFDAQRMYLAPGYTWTARASTTLQIYDLADPAHPHLAGETQVPGAVWSFFPQGNSVMALGSDASQSSQRVSVNAIDATDPVHPLLAGTVEFGDGWAWTPAAGTFKAFTRNDALGLIVLPFAGWSSKSFAYRNGLQLIESSSSAIHSAGAAITRGWVERGIFANGRLLALSDLSLSVVDYSDHQHPRVVTDLTLARNTTSALPMGDRIAEVSSDFWDNDLSSSTVRVLPIAAADELTSAAAVAETTIDGVNARVFRNGDLAYLVSDVRFEVPCASGPSVWVDADGKCRQWSQEVQVVDLSGGGARVRGKAILPGFFGWGFPGPGFFGCFAWDWFNGADAVQVEGDALAFRRWFAPGFMRSGMAKPQQGLFIVSLANPDAPAVSQLTLTDDDSAWWGNLVLVGDALYATHEEWMGGSANTRYPTVRYWANRMDIRDRAHPRVASRVNVPGVVIGGPASDPSLLYVTGYRWSGDQAVNSFDVLRLHGDSAELIGSVDIDGWVGRTFVRGTTALVSAEQWNRQGNGAGLTLHQIDLANPAHPVDRAADSRAGWGWLVGLEGDRAVVTSGWGGAGLDVYRLAAGAPPQLDRFVRTRGWWPSALARQGDDLFISSGYWGVETIHLGAAP